MQISIRVLSIGLLGASLSGCFTTPTKTARLPDVVGPAATASTEPAPPAKVAEPAAAATPTQRKPPAPAEPGDVWQRIRDGFSLHIPKNRRIDQLMHVYRKQERMDRIQARAAPWLHYIANELERRELPMELALLPAVESAYQARVFSPRGAAGIWQFMGATGGQYGLEQNWWYDGRMDVVDSTRAALDYLSWLQRRYHGDWLLALAAYNSGIRTVDRAIRHNKRRGRPHDFWHLRLPRETRSYVPQWLALLRIIRDPERYGVALHPVEDRQTFATLQIDKPIDLRVAAKLTGIPLADLVTLNPGLKHLHTGSNDGYKLHLPRHRVDDFKKKLASIPTAELAGWRQYRVKPGDVLGRIARRNGITVTAIKQANNLKSSRIRIGQRLKLPIGEGAAPLVIARQGKSRTKPVKAARPRPASPRPAVTAGKQQARGIAYKVRSGDSLWVIARRFGVPVARLAAWNDIAINQTLRPGRTLRIHTGSRAADKGSTRIHYKVRKGDSLYLIARRFRVKMDQLQSWNKLDDKYLMPGQKLTLYLE